MQAPLAPFFPAPESTPSEAAQAESIAATPMVIPEQTPVIESTQKMMRNGKKKGEA